MSNLGIYQTTVTWMKRLGPKGFYGVLIGGPAAIGGGLGFVLGKLAGGDTRKSPKLSRRNKTQTMQTPVCYTVRETQANQAGRTLRPGERFAVLGQDGDAVMIAVEDDADNPYIVSDAYLRGVSDFGKQEEK